MKSSTNSIASTNESETINNRVDFKDNKWHDAIFVDEMKERLASFDNGNAKTYSWAEVQAEAQGALSTKKQNK